jgi:N-alpha-acetyltransferase 50
MENAAKHTKPPISKAYLHVQVSNEDAKRFYEQHGFVAVRVHNDYYRKLQPRDAWVLEKTIERTTEPTS